MALYFYGSYKMTGHFLLLVKLAQDVFSLGLPIIHAYSAHNKTQGFKPIRPGRSMNGFVSEGVICKGEGEVGKHHIWVFQIRPARFGQIFSQPISISDIKPDKVGNSIPF